MKITCNIIHDLMPSYIDKICSKDSCNLIEEHIKNCPNCKQKLKSLINPISFVEVIDKEKAQEPFKKIKRKNHLQIIVAIIITSILLVSTIMAIQNISVLYNFFYPQKRVLINNETEQKEWSQLSINGNPYLNFTSPFYKKEIINDANSSGTLKIRILNKQKNILIKETTIAPGQSLKLKNLKNFEDYIVETKNTKGIFFLLFH